MTQVYCLESTNQESGCTKMLKISSFLQLLRNHLNITTSTSSSVCPFAHVPCVFVQKLGPIPFGVSQNVNNKSCLLCFRVKKHSEWALGSMKQGKANPCKLCC